MSAQPIRQTAALTAVGLAGRTVATKNPPCAGGRAARLRRRSRDAHSRPSTLFKVDTPRPALEGARARRRAAREGAPLEKAPRAAARRKRAPGRCVPRRPSERRPILSGWSSGESPRARPAGGRARRPGAAAQGQSSKFPAAPLSVSSDAARSTILASVQSAGSSMRPVLGLRS